MIDVDYIMSLLDWNNSIERQELGIMLAKKVECINVFIQPGSCKYGKNVWGNCAKVLSSKSNEELFPYLVELMRWLQDMNWPGAFCIFKRLKTMSNEPFFQHCLEKCLTVSRALHDDVWENNLNMILKS